jgi:hypothetical protein
MGLFQAPYPSTDPRITTAGNAARRWLTTGLAVVGAAASVTPILPRRLRLIEQVDMRAIDRIWVRPSSSSHRTPPIATPMAEVDGGR